VHTQKTDVYETGTKHFIFEIKSFETFVLKRKNGVLALYGSLISANEMIVVSASSQLCHSLYMLLSTWKFQVIAGSLQRFCDILLTDKYNFNQRRDQPRPLTVFPEWEFFLSRSRKKNSRTSRLRHW